jgi:hypothetical protein
LSGSDRETTPRYDLDVATNEIVRLRFLDDTAELYALDQYRMYEGVLEGGPTHELNETLLEGLGSQPGEYLVPPMETPLEVVDRAPSGRYVRLPWIHCEGLFRADLLDLKVIWFQDKWAMPVDPQVRAHIRQIEFHREAVVNDFFDRL